MPHTMVGCSITEALVKCIGVGTLRAAIEDKKPARVSRVRNWVKLVRQLRWEGFGSLGSRVACEDWWEVTWERIGLGAHCLCRKSWVVSLRSLTSCVEVLPLVKSGTNNWAVNAGTNTRH